MLKPVLHLVTVVFTLDVAPIVFSFIRMETNQEPNHIILLHKEAIREVTWLPLVYFKMERKRFYV